MRLLCDRLILAAALLAGTALANAQPRPAVVELFTSEGCSSCPPAEAYIGELTQRPDVLALTFHVQYWDDLGWRDRFGLPQATARQRAYAQSLQLSSVYTPQVVIDGTRDFVGSDRAAIGKSLSSQRSGVSVAASIHDGNVYVDLVPQSVVVNNDVVLVAFQRTALSPIGRGENSGRTIKEFNIVREIRNLGRWQGEQRQYQLKLSSLPHDATDIAVLVQNSGYAPIIGAASVALPAVN